MYISRAALHSHRMLSVGIKPEVPHALSNLQLKKTRMLYVAAVICIGAPLLVALLVQYQFLFMRYHFEYAFQAVKWQLFSQCPSGAQGSTVMFSSSSPNWTTLLSNQLHLAASPERWVVSKYDVGLGLCNRILNSISALLLAMATNRTLWLEWEQQAQVFITSNEFAGMSSYDDLFISPFHDRQLRPPSAVIDNATHIGNDCWLERMRFSDLGQAYAAHKAIRIDAGDWWGSLLLRNPVYANTVFKGLKISDGFPILFRAMFTLHPPGVEPEKACSWMIQYRTVWPPPRYTAPIDAFLACAERNGMTRADFGSTWIVTDDPAGMRRQASLKALRILEAMNVPSVGTCRGPCGDRQAMETMYRMSQCRNAVLTLGSSFGACISSLAGIRRQFRVSHYGECIPFAAENGPLDANSYSRNGNLATFLASKA
jgi:hypothetical protein